MQSFIPPIVSIRQRISVECCDKPVPRARRLSLPTLRERRYLKEMHIERIKGKSVRFAREETFNLMIWPLTVTEPQDDRYSYSFAKFMEEINEDHESEYQQLEYRYGDTFQESLKLKGDGLYFEDGHTPTEGKVEELEFASCPIRFEIPSWAYIVRVRASKSVLGKRAVQRNRAKRRIRAAAAKIMPNHAKRGYEYIFSAFPESLTSPFSAILADVEQSLRSTCSWTDHLREEELRRDMYCKR